MVAKILTLFFMILGMVYFWIVVFDTINKYRNGKQ